MAQVLGVVANVLGVFGFFASSFQNPNPNVCNVRIAAALNGPELSGADGTIQAVRIYNENQQLIGSRGGGYIGSGGFADFGVQQSNNQQAMFVQIQATNDAICIPYATTTFVDGAKYGWVGDWGAFCGLNWYYGNVVVDGSYKPRCTWIDNDHTNDFKAGMLMIHWIDFTNKRTQGSRPADYCRYPAFRAYTPEGGSIFKRDAADEPTHVDPRLVISSEPGHNATELCASNTSRGPDFVSLFEGIYCNMETRETVPVCDTGVTGLCFNAEAKQLQKPDGRVEQKNFTEVIAWN
ncbi:hypothetical protein J3E72DRAFT_379734 [Bipolaris maydis]|uniref:uncharacterized protein n=1 Tax=Cochliobolus heterostrophus TaxID=5016 RepID=UPI00032617CB|nr:hypothetical protein J3E73DRAFT_182517 [Bipolaris maydis]KAJ5062079.1 hypothetical protein J3E74DRAFT_405342 [Bipolaris maydis]KAJ6192584.1 hypothetical protein J3E72DRAFT_379734 [Bipolaris maydis]KAJ6276195.1 hypothetical protein PSV08DRAFT_169894 [Bipolaris maydis]KAJ6287338.1 hypothetical protein J3E71DRAFT_164823 [Bipolaris maydis]